MRSSELAFERISDFLLWVPGDQQLRKDLSKPWLDRNWEKLNQPDSTIELWIRRAGSWRVPRMNGAIPNVIVLGDSQDFRDATDFLGNAISIRLDPSGVDLQTSISGFPPIYCLESREVTLYASALESLLQVTSNRKLDKNAIVDLAETGHALEGRTLFEGVSILRPGIKKNVSREGAVLNGKPFTRDVACSSDDDEKRNFHQGELLSAALGRMDLTRTVLSLTAGLDTRAILAALIKMDRLIPAVTLSGARDSIDARTAAALAKHYGFEHCIVRLDEEFESSLPRYCEIASRRSGGLASFEQAPEVHLYDSLNDRFEARLSGFLGNQVGRSGTEGCRTRRASLKILNQGLFGELTAVRRPHWLRRGEGRTSKVDPLFLIQTENLHASLANYLVGSSFALQQSPYADSRLIRNKLSEPESLWRGTTSSLQLRIKDLVHRFLGEPSSRSFQRHLIRETGGYVSHRAVNWGWRPSGGVDAIGLGLGGTALLDMLFGSRLAGVRTLRKLRRATAILGISGFNPADFLYSKLMVEFAKDTLKCTRARDSGVFDLRHLEKLLEEFHDKRHYSTIVFALDVALGIAHSGGVAG